MKIILLYVFILLLSACANNGVTKNGYSLDPRDISQVRVGISDKQSVLELLDYPTNISVIEQNKWIYYSYTTKRLMFFKPKIIEQDVVIISFSNADIVNKIKKYNLDNAKNINPSIIRTQVQNREQGIFQDIINNIGSITPAI
jgi:outer membrane protein assembly factor BamE (lipoprotein component of BamABCDE complex)